MLARTADNIVAVNQAKGKLATRNQIRAIAVAWRQLDAIGFEGVHESLRTFTAPKNEQRSHLCRRCAEKGVCNDRPATPLGVCVGQYRVGLCAGVLPRDRGLAPQPQHRPLVMWPVDGATIRMKTDWDGLPGSVRYVQVTGKSGPDGNILLDDNQLIYIRLNPRTHTPFGLGRLEVAFEAVNAFLGAQRYATKLASNSVVEYALWLQGLTPEHHERLIRWWQDEIEGTGRVPVLSTEQKPEVLRFAVGTGADLRIQWQEFLLRMIAIAFECDLVKIVADPYVPDLCGVP